MESLYLSKKLAHLKFNSKVANQINFMSKAWFPYNRKGSQKVSQHCLVHDTGYLILYGNTLFQLASAADCDSVSAVPEELN